MSTLPQTAIDVLPFSAEPMFQWRKEADRRPASSNPLLVSAQNDLTL